MTSSTEIGTMAGDCVSTEMAERMATAFLNDDDDQVGAIFNDVPDENLEEVSSLALERIMDARTQTDESAEFCASLFDIAGELDFRGRVVIDGVEARGTLFAIPVRGTLAGVRRMLSVDGFATDLARLFRSHGLAADRSNVMVALDLPIAAGFAAIMTPARLRQAALSLVPLPAPFGRFSHVGERIAAAARALDIEPGANFSGAEGLDPEAILDDFLILGVRVLLDGDSDHLDFGAYGVEEEEDDAGDDGFADCGLTGDDPDDGADARLAEDADRGIALDQVFVAAAADLLTARGLADEVRISAPMPWNAALEGLMEDRLQAGMEMEAFHLGLGESFTMCDRLHAVENHETLSLAVMAEVGGHVLGPVSTPPYLLFHTRDAFYEWARKVSGETVCFHDSVAEMLSACGIRWH